MKLYLTDTSGNSYKVRVLASILGVEYEKVYIDWDEREHKSSEFLELNLRGQVPVMKIEGRIFWDSTAHLVYLARKYGGEQWLPGDPLDMAEVMQWMALAQNEIYFGLQWARGVLVYGRRPYSLADYQLDGRKGLEVMERRLSANDWLALDRATIADIACYPYVKRAPQGDVSLEPYPGVKAWLARCEALPGWLELR
jgi:glutathione S-transferase